MWRVIPKVFSVSVMQALNSHVADLNEVILWFVGMERAAVVHFFVRNQKIVEL